MIAACYSNPNWDGKDNADKRKQYLDDINRHFNQAITAIYYPDGPREADVDWDNPFFAAHKREIERTKVMFAEALGQDGKTAGDLLEEEQAREVDQLVKSGNGRARDYDQLVDDDDDVPRNKPS